MGAVTGNPGTTRKPRAARLRNLPAAIREGWRCVMYKHMLIPTDDSISPRTRRPPA